MGGIIIRVGVADRLDDPVIGRDVHTINQMLASLGLPEHHEPPTVPADGQWNSDDEIAESYLLRLQRLQAWVNQGRGLPPELAAGEDPTADPVIQDEISMLRSHLLLHSSEGYFVPIKFDEPEPAPELTGRALSSSQGLMEDLMRSGPALGIELSDGLVPQAQVEQILHEEESPAPYGPERLMWFALYDSARRSINHKALIFHSW